MMMMTLSLMMTVVMMHDAIDDVRALGLLPTSCHHPGMPMDLDDLRASYSSHRVKVAPRSFFMLQIS